MQSAGKNYAKRQAQKEFLRQYNDMRCEAFKQNCTDITRQAVAMMICGLSMYGYDKSQIETIYNQFLEVLNFPEFFGEKLTTAVAEKRCEELGIDLSKIHVEVEMIEK